MKNSDYVVQEREPEFDRDCLHRPLFAVNMRLYSANQRYRDHIRGVLSYMDWILYQKWEDYASAKDGGKFGISGANLGIPYNIIAFRTKNEKGLVVHRCMINPRILGVSKDLVETMSNCGSIKFKQKIPIKRHTWIEVEYYDWKGELKKEKLTTKEGAFTIQHEVDHNNGILITDRYIQQGGDKGLLERI